MYIVTGGAGFIGSNIVRTLNETSATPVIVVDDLESEQKFRNLADCQVADYLSVAEFGELCQAEIPLPGLKAILHNGACADTMENDGDYMMARNFSYSRDVLYYAQEMGVPLVYASSAAVYGVGQTALEAPAYERPINVYAYSKLAFDQHIRAQAKHFNSPVIGLRYFNVYGPREKHKGRMASMVYQLARQLRENGVARLFTGTDGYPDGGQERDFVSAQDVVKANLHFAAGKGRENCGIYNIGTGRALSFNEVAKTLIDILGRGRIEYIPFPEKLIGKYQSFTQADLTNLRAAGYTADFCPLETGIKAAAADWGLTGD